MIQNQVQLKGLQSRRIQVQEEIKQLQQQAREINDSLNHKKRQESDINRQIASITQKDIVITEHAILRFLERSMGLNIEDIKKTMLPEVTKKQILELGGKGNFPLPQGGKLRVTNNTVVTVID